MLLQIQENNIICRNLLFTKGSSFKIAYDWIIHKCTSILNMCDIFVV